MLQSVIPYFFHSSPPTLSPLSPFPFLIHTPQPLPLIDSLRRFPTASVQIHPKVRPSLDVPNPFPSFLISNFRFPFLALPSTRLDPVSLFAPTRYENWPLCDFALYCNSGTRALSSLASSQGSPDVQIAYPSTTTISISTIWSG